MPCSLSCPPTLPPTPFFFSFSFSFLFGCYFFLHLMSRRRQAGGAAVGSRAKRSIHQGAWRRGADLDAKVPCARVVRRAAVRVEHADGGQTVRRPEIVDEAGLSQLPTQPPLVVTRRLALVLQPVRSQKLPNKQKINILIKINRIVILRKQEKMSRGKLWNIFSFFFGFTWRSSSLLLRLSKL